MRLQCYIFDVHMLRLPFLGSIVQMLLERKQKVENCVPIIGDK